VSWFVAAWGVFIKDMTQIVPVFVQMLLFLSPVFYPASAVPASLQAFYRYNPVGAVIETMRSALSGNSIDWPRWIFALVVSLAASILGYAFFQQSREEFADAL
jgi:lipopolysaccharide transport system permease protein